MTFPCDRCGQCCRNVDKVEQLREFDNGSGVCVHLADNLCNIYDTRPILCNVERAYREIFSGTMTEDE